jgi:hypothetical protein
VAFDVVRQLAIFAIRARRDVVDVANEGQSTALSKETMQTTIEIGIDKVHW